MFSFTGPILSMGKSVTGISYSKEVLIDMVDTFNAKYDNSSAIGQLSAIYPSPPQINPEKISHETVKLRYNDDTGKVIAYINFLNNTTGLHLTKLFKNANDRVIMCPVLSGKTDDNNNAVEVELVRVDFFYNNSFKK